MGDDEEGAVGELLADAVLDEGVGRHVDGGRRFVENHDFGPGDDGAREAEKLALALGEIEPAFADARAE